MTMMENCKAIFASVYTIITACAMCVCVFTLYMPRDMVGGGVSNIWRDYEVNGFYFAATTQRF